MGTPSPPREIMATLPLNVAGRPSRYQGLKEAVIGLKAIPLIWNCVLMKHWVGALVFALLYILAWGLTFGGMYTMMEINRLRATGSEVPVWMYPLALGFLVLPATPHVLAWIQEEMYSDWRRDYLETARRMAERSQRG
jgi:hypothetical protein